MKEIRNNIELIDKEILTLFEKRLSLCLEIGKKKYLRNIKIRDIKREKEVLKYITLNSAEKFKIYNLFLFSNIMNITRFLQYENRKFFYYCDDINHLNKKIYRISAFVLEKDIFLLKFFKRNKILKYRSFLKAFDSFENKKSDFLLCKAENLKKLLKKRNIKIHLNCYIKFKDSTYYIISRKLYVGNGNFKLVLDLKINNDFFSLFTILTIFNLKNINIDSLSFYGESIDVCRMHISFKLHNLNGRYILNFLKILSLNCKKLKILKLFKIIIL